MLRHDNPNVGEFLYRPFILLMGLLGSAPALAQTSLIEGGVEEAWKALKRLPPSRSWDFAFMTGYGDIPYWRLETPPALSFGFRASSGWHLKNQPSQRIGWSIATGLDGPVPINFAWTVEPALAWDVVNTPALFGISLGPAISYNAAMGISRWEDALTAGGSVAVRLGYSEPYSRVGRRFFVFVEPKLRLLPGPDERLVGSPIFHFVVGSGLGR